MPIIKRFVRLPILIQIAVNINILFFLWIIFYKFLRPIAVVDYFYEQGIYYLTKYQLDLSAKLLRLLGYKVEVLGKLVAIKGTGGVVLDRGCLGRNVMALFVGFILVIPSKFSQKLWMSVLGILVFLILNIIRIATLAIIEYCCEQYLQINHHLVFKVLIYGVMLLLWFIWLRSVRKSGYWDTLGVRRQPEL
jgi:exosortase/archaeosortase family protein